VTAPLGEIAGNQRGVKKGWGEKNEAGWGWEISQDGTNGYEKRLRKRMKRFGSRDRGWSKKNKKGADAGSF